MDLDEFRKKEHARLAAQIEEAKNSHRQTVEGLAARYPEIESRLWQYYEQYCQDLDAGLTRFDEGQRTDLDETVETQKRQAWELLTILGSVEPELSIASLHDEMCAAIDQVAAAAKSQIREIDDATPRTKAAMGDVTIDYHLAKSKDERHE